MLLIALYAAGLVLLMREAVPWIRAKSSGVGYTRGHRREAVRREENPERFSRLMDRRFRAMGPGALMLVVAVIWTLWLIVSLVFAPT